LTYRKGVELERHVRKMYEEMGYMVMRSAGSKGPFDLIAINEHEVVCIQVKATARSTIRQQEKMRDLLSRLPRCVDVVMVSQAPYHGVVTSHLGTGLSGPHKRRPISAPGALGTPRNDGGG